MSTITSHKINLQDRSERATYSQKLIEFEYGFLYPLGDKSFRIVHGLERPHDYFSFFEQLGELSCFVLEDEGRVIGVVCAVLRDVGHKKVWYLCDFKLHSNYRGQKLYRNLMWKYFLSHCLKSHRFFALNMSPVEDNRLWSHTKEIFSFFSVVAQPRYLHTLNLEMLNQLKKNQEINNYKLVTNMGKKDIVVDDKRMKLFHLVPSNRPLIAVQEVDFTELPEDATIMLLNTSTQPMMVGDIVQETTLISHYAKEVEFSSAEI